jgi:soluble lytic murein transglycosylase-like protein
VKFHGELLGQSFGLVKLNLTNPYFFFFKLRHHTKMTLQATLRTRAILALASFASILSTLSCTSLSTHSDRDPASIAEACRVDAPAIDPTRLASQILYQLQEKEKAARGTDLLLIYEQEFLRLQQMIFKSRLYSTGLSEESDPRLAIAEKALALTKTDKTLNSSQPIWIERIYILEPSRRISPTDDQIQSKAAALIRKSQTPAARTLLMALSEKVSAPLETRLSARLDLLKSNRFQGSDDEFLKQLELNRNWYAKVFSAEAQPSALAIKQYSLFFQALIRGHMKKEKFDLAEIEISALKKFLITEKQSAGGADWLSGRLRELRGEINEAKQSYAAAVRELPSDDVSVEQLDWQLGWLNYKAGNYDRAIELWNSLPMTSSAQVLARNLYWTSRAVASQGNQGKAADLNRRLRQMHPATFYAALASRDLGEKIPTLKIEKSECVLAGRVLARMKRKYSADDVAAFAALYRQRDLPRAKQVLMDLSLAQGLDSSLYLAAAVMGDYQPLLLGFPKLTLSEQNELYEQFPQLLFPNPFPDLILEATKANGLDPYFPLSTIRQESVFAPYAVSFADARGLMQVMPQIGEAYAKTLHLEGYSKEKLFEPSTNIPIGTRHLKEGLVANHGSYILTLAAYNAGDEIAGVWDRHLSKDPLEFIEDVPFNETNGYIKAILRNQINNQALYGEGLAFEFPQALLKR